ncbi:MAG: hypothetical protein IT273_03065 [Chitinophagales bacterium]|nr:hypothetical protein [Chitinophagales bacterium]
MFKKNLFVSAFIMALMAMAGIEAWAQSHANELKTYLQQLEIDKQQYSNDPARYQEYENKITAIKKELAGNSPQTKAPVSVSNVRLRGQEMTTVPTDAPEPAVVKTEREVQAAILKDLKAKYEELKQAPSANCRACDSIAEMAREIARLEEMLK